MTSRNLFIQPPRIALWLIGLFTSGKQVESIPGDLLEEYSQVVSKSGAAAAQRWYWQEAGRTIMHLIAGGFRLAPWSTSAAILGGFLLSRVVHGLPDKLLSAVTDKYLMFWSAHFNAYLWVLKGMLLAHLMASLFVGSIVALAAKGREMVATITLSLILGAMAVASFFVIVIQTGDASFSWILPLSFADSFAIVLGGVVVRMRRRHFLQLA